MNSIYQEIAKLEQEGREFAICTVVEVEGSSPAHASFKMIVLPDGTQQGTVGGGTLELNVLAVAREVIAERKPRIISFDLNLNSKTSIGMVCGGQIKLYIEYVGSRPQLYIYGAGHVGRSLATFASLVGFEVTIMDDRPEFATPTRVPEAHHFLTGDFVELIKATDYGTQGYHVILTDKHASDELVLKAILERKLDYHYIGMIGSKSKVLDVFRHLMAAGVSREDLARVYTPIGIDHGGQTAEEIALAICAELVAARHDHPLTDSMKNKANVIEGLERKP